MSQPFSRTFRVRWSETNAVGHVDIAGCLRYLVETAWDWGAAGGLGMAESEALGVAWIIRETELNIYRPLKPRDRFDFTIWLANWRRVRGTRCFELRLKEGGELVAQGAQQVATLDIETLRPIRLPDELLGSFLLHNPPQLPQRKFPKVQELPAAAVKHQRVVEWQDLDIFGHVNNAVYAAFAEDAAVQAFAAAGWSPAQFNDQKLYINNQRFHIRYQAPALWADALQTAVHLTALSPSGGTWHLVTKRVSDNETIVQCVIDWSLADRDSGQEQPLPQSLLLALQEMVAV